MTNLRRFLLFLNLPRSINDKIIFLRMPSLPIWANRYPFWALNILALFNCTFQLTRNILLRLRHEATHTLRSLPADKVSSSSTIFKQTISFHILEAFSVRCISGSSCLSNVNIVLRSHWCGDHPHVLVISFILNFELTTLFLDIWT